MNEDDPTAGAIARLEQAAAPVGDGNFTLDGAAARHKLAERQLSEPDAWVLLVLEAAERIGSIRVEVIERVIGLRIRLVGPGAVELAPPAELPALFDWLFTEPVPEELAAPGERRRAEARRLLALAVNTASAGLSRRVVLHSRSPAAGSSLTIDAAASPKPGPGSTGEPRLDLDIFDTWTRPARVRSEALLIVARAGYGQWPIHVGGRPLPPQPHIGTRKAEAFIELGGERIGKASMLHVEAEPRLILVSNGVALEPVPLPGYTWGFHAVVADAVERDLSLGRVVQDARYEAVLASVAEAHERLVAQLAAHDGPAGQGPGLARWNGTGGLHRVPAPPVRMPVAPLWQAAVVPAAIGSALLVIIGLLAQLWGMAAVAAVVWLAPAAVLAHRRRQLQLYGNKLDIQGALDEASRQLEERLRRNRHH